MSNRGMRDGINESSVRERGVDVAAGASRNVEN